MNGSRIGSRNSRRRRLKVAPVTRAVRMALAASAAAFALVGSGAAFAQSCVDTPPSTTLCDGVFTDSIDITTIDDLTLVVGSQDPTTSVTPGDYYSAILVDVGGDASIDNQGVLSTYGAAAINAYATGSLDIDNSGDIDVYGASAIAASALGDVTVGSTGAIDAEGLDDITAISAYSGAGAVSATNGGDLEINTYGSATGVWSYSIDGDASAANTGSIDVYAYSGSAIGVYAYSIGGDASVDNDGYVRAYSYNGIADGMFASGANVTAANGADGEIFAYGYGWAAGVEAEGSDSTQVTNSGFVGAMDFAENGQASGIYATGGAGGISIENGFGGTVVAIANAEGSSATGIFASAVGEIDINNAGEVGAYAAEGLATGIHASTGYPGGDVTIGNDGTVKAYGYYAGTGIEALATGAGASASVTNTGDIFAAQESEYGYGANGIVASGDLDATIDNSGGIDVESGGLAYGAAALAFNGTASVTNTGDVDVSSSAFLYYGAYGLLASSSNGTAVVDNSGMVDVSALYYGHGILASGTAGSTVTNSGDVTSDAWLSYGILATSGSGDVAITNTEDGTVAGIYSVGDFYAQVFGIAGISTAGDVDIHNDGSVYAGAFGSGMGIAALAVAGDANVANTGTINVYTYGDAIGALTRADYGTASFDSSGYIGVESYVGSAFGAQVAGVNATVVNSGDISATAMNGQATGVFARGSGSVSVSNDGSVYAYAGAKYGQAVGVYASGYVSEEVGVAGNVSVATGAESSIEALAQQGIGIGVFGYSGTGTVSIDNAGTVYAGGAVAGIGLYASTDGDITIDNSGIVQAGGGAQALGIAANSVDGAIALSNSGDVQASALYGPSTGMSAYSIYGDVSLENTGSLDAESQADAAIGMYAYSMYGNAGVVNNGAITAYSEYGLADGIFASGANVDVSAGADSDISATGYNWAAGIEAQGSDSTTVDNDGIIEVTSSDAGSKAMGIYATGANVDVSTGADSDISATGYNWAAGIEAQGSDSTTVDNDGIIEVTSFDAGSKAMGIYATAGTGGLTIDNSGPITALGYFASGIYAQSNGSASITNSGDIAAGDVYTVDYNGYSYVYGSATGTGIHLASGYEGSALSVANSGAITADGYFSGTGIEVLATGDGGTGTVANTGDISVSQYTKYGYGAAGIVVSADGDSSITNSGAINAVSAGAAYGALGLSFNGEANVANSGDITVESSALKYYGAYGVLASSANGTAVASNSGSIDVTTAYNGFGVNASGTAGSTATNSGDITVDGYLAYGVLATSGSGDAVASNGVDGTINSGYTYYNYGGTAFGVAAISTNGDASANNAGSVYTFTGGQTYALAALSAHGNASVTNSGDVAANSYAGPAAGAFARADYGTASVDNSGSLVANSPSYAAYGVIAEGDMAAVKNSGDIAATGYYAANGVLAIGLNGATLDNDGDIAAIAAGYGYGARVQSAYGDVTVDNSGTIQASGDYLGGVGVIAIAHNNNDLAFGNVTIGNSGTIAATSEYYGYATGLSALGYDVTVNNSGSLQAEAYGDATGVMASAYHGLEITNDGAMAASSSYGAAVGLRLQSGESLSLSGEGDIDASSESGFAQGINAYAVEDLSITGTGDISVEGLVDAMGIYLTAGGAVQLDLGGSMSVDSGEGVSRGALVFGNDILASNSGSLVVTGYAGAYGVQLYGHGEVSLDNSGDISVSSPGGSHAVAVDGGSAKLINSGNIEAVGGNGIIVHGGSAALYNSGTINSRLSGNSRSALVSGGSGEVLIENSGTIAASSDNYALGLDVDSSLGSVEFSSSGSITSDGGGFGSRATTIYALYEIAAENSGSIIASGEHAYAASLIGNQGVDIANSGTIRADGGSYAGALYASSYFGDVNVHNIGTISANADVSAVALASNFAGALDVNNSGTIAASGAGEGNVALTLGGDTVLSLENTGSITGAIITLGGDDLVSNGAGGKWNVNNHATDFGDGDDVLHNLAGGTIALADGAIYFGDGAGNSFFNEGTITVSGTNVIDMAGNSPGFGPLSLSIVPMDAPTAPFENNGIIDFADGDATDILTITGDFAGQGDINLDVNLLNGASDLLYIDGDVVDGTQQTVNLSVDDIGDVTNQTPAQFLTVTGSVPDGAFVAGNVVGFGTGNFIDLNVQLTPSTQGGTTVFSASVAVAGLNSSGVLAADIVPGAQSLIASSIGTLRQRNGAGKTASDYGLGAWVRVFDNDGDIDPAHTQDFGSAGDFGFSQSNHGTEFGLSADFDGPIGFGILLGDADATQRMHDGSGTDRFKLHTAGLYGTWSTPAFYIDLSYRWMSFDATLNSAGGEQLTGGDATAFNAEAGYTGWSMSGFNIVPQVQYTSSHLQNVDPVQGSIVDFESGGSTSKRGRLGVEINRSFQSGTFSWTPYIAASTVHESDGEAVYMIANTFSGTTDTSGTSTLVEAGIGAQVGGFRATLGGMWSDGGATDSVSGGQLVLRYNW